MLFKSVLCLGLLGGASAAVLDVPEINTAFTSVSRALTTLDTSILAITQANVNTQITTVTRNSNAVVTALNTGASNVAKSKPITNIINAISLAQSGIAVLTATNKTITDLINKSPILLSANKGATIVSELQVEQTATANFLKAIVANLPAEIATTAAALDLGPVAGIIFSRAIAVFSGAPDPGFLGMGTAAPAAAPAAAPTVATAAPRPVTTAAPRPVTTATPRPATPATTTTAAAHSHGGA